MRYLLGVCTCLIILVLTKIFLWHKLTETNNKIMPLPVVDISHVKMLDIQNHITASGIIKSPLSVDIVSEVPGKVINVLFKSGQTVQKGDIVLILNHATLSAEIEEAEAKYIYQKRNFQRFLELAKRGVIARDNIDNLKSQLDQEAAKIHSLYAELDKRMLRAPFSGLLGISDISLGQYIQAGEKIVNLRNDKSIILDLILPSRYIQNIFIGQPVSINSLDNQCGSVETVDTKLESHTHGITIRVEMKNCHVSPISGTLVTAYILTMKSHFLTVPATSLNYSINGNSVFVIQGHRVKQVKVNVEVNDDMAIIKNGNLNQDDWVVSRGQEKIFDNQEVNTHVSQ